MQAGPNTCSEELCRALQSERNSILARTKQRQTYGKHQGEDYPCHMCPMKYFGKRQRLQQHQERDHQAPQFCCSSKQLQVLRAKWTECTHVKVAANSMLLEPPSLDTAHMLQVSADAMRRMLCSCPSYVAALKGSVVTTSVRHLFCSF